MAPNAIFRDILISRLSWKCFSNSTAKYSCNKACFSQFDKGIYKFICFLLVSHPCSEKNGGCSHICRISYGLSLSSKKNKPTAICGCPLNYHPDQNEKNCSGKSHLSETVIKKVFVIYLSQ